MIEKLTEIDFDAIDCKFGSEPGIFLLWRLTLFLRTQRPKLAVLKLREPYKKATW